MDVIGIICEYNPFHNGHKYHIDKIKELYPDSLIILVLNGYFLERGEVSVLTKEDKTKIALENNIDIVLEHPFVFGSNSADIFAESSVIMLNHLKVNKIIFGSESNDIETLTKIAKMQLEEDFHQKVKEHLKKGINYPTALNKSLDTELNTPNDLLGVAYIKAILKNNFDIKPITIKRTNSYHDIKSNNSIVSASNIRTKFKNKQSVDKYTSYAHLIQNINEELLFKLLKYKILTEPNLNKYLSIDEGIEYKLIKEINNASSVEELIMKVKSKRYTYNRIRRMLIHILIGLTKEDKNQIDLEYIKVLGFNKKGQEYLKKHKKDSSIPITRKISTEYLAQRYELKASLLYDLLTENNTYEFELKNKPIIK
ncbi:MAG: nucleotidyltransferase [Mollicutes bacterium]|nr:nucleotidyltransferase [Mollicutes bacterium]